eukprot:720090-Amphidinium_carterae.1
MSCTCAMLSIGNDARVCVCVCVLHRASWGGFRLLRMGQREKTRKAKAAARAASASSMRTVEEDSTLPPDNEMEVDPDAPSATAASAAAASPAAAAAATSTTSTLQAVLSVRGTSREPKGTGSGTALPGGPVSEGDSEVPQSMKRKGKEELKAEDVNPSGVVQPLPPGQLSLGSLPSQ